MDKLKTFVGRKVGGSAGNALSTHTRAPQESLMNQLSKAFNATNSALFPEKEWQCPCGHRFRSSDEWMVCAPVYCEVPSCPNPKFYLNGSGRALLEANPSGLKLDEVKDGANPKLAASNTSSGPKKTGVASRFK